MHFGVSLLSALLCANLLTQGLNSLYFEDGYDHHYTYASESDVLGMHNVTSIIKFRVRSVNDTGTESSLCRLMVDSFVQHSEQGYVADNPMKWKLDHKFYFTVGKDGLVTLVHFDPEEKHELLTLKKVLASTLSTKVKLGSSEPYTFEEEDHAGIMEHEYSTHRHDDGIKVIRGHRSTRDVHRTHNKTVDFDWLGTPIRVESTDNITLGDSANMVTRKTVEGAAEIHDEQTGDFPDIGTVSRTEMKLTSKSKHQDTYAHNLTSMVKDTLQVRQKPKPKFLLSAVERDIRNYTRCISSIENKYDRERTECVHQLRDLVIALNQEDFLQLGRNTLSIQCDANDTLCTDEKNLFIDIVAREGSHDAQLLMLTMVMKHVNVTEEELRRCLFHCIAIKNPIMELVKHVEEICFQNHQTDGETPGLEKNHRRACLSLGAMANSLYETNASVADGIVERIENWLQHHNESKSLPIIKHRVRRSITQVDEVAQSHIETKTTLIQSLGNAAHPRSIRHIKSYMEPNVGTTAWRRAAINSLRKFNCFESANSLLTSAVHDDDEVVRKSALNVLKNHPKRKQFSLEQENIVLSRNYSYSVVTRVRRGVIETLEKGIQKHIELPGIEWGRNIGNSKLGASFGLVIRNLMDLKLGLLDGHFMVDVHDEAYAEAHVGMIGVNVEILKALVCFKGHIKYDLNVLKDFGINGLSDLVKIYDKIVADIIDPIKIAVTNF